MHRILIPKIFEECKPENMECIQHTMIDMIDCLKLIDHDMYERVEHKLYKMVHGEHLSKELAHKWVSKMENKDGTHGAHWTMEQTDQYAGTHNKCDWYAVMNMVYSDYYNPKFDTTTYIELARDWINDSDVGEGKTLKYYLHVVCDE